MGSSSWSDGVIGISESVMSFCVMAYEGLVELSISKRYSGAPAWWPSPCCCFDCCSIVSANFWRLWFWHFCRSCSCYYYPPPIPIPIPIQLSIPLPPHCRTLPRWMSWWLWWWWRCCWYVMSGTYCVVVALNFHCKTQNEKKNDKLNIWWAKREKIGKEIARKGWGARSDGAEYQLRAHSGKGHSEEHTFRRVERLRLLLRRHCNMRLLQLQMLLLLLLLHLLLCIRRRQWQRQLGPSHHTAAANGRLHTTTNGTRYRLLGCIPAISSGSSTGSSLRSPAAGGSCAASIAASRRRLVRRRAATRMAAAGGQGHDGVTALVTVPLMRMGLVMRSGTAMASTGTTTSSPSSATTPTASFSAAGIVLRFMGWRWDAAGPGASLMRMTLLMKMGRISDKLERRGLD